MRTNFEERLDGCSGFPEIFELVKESVNAVIGRSRTGLILGLSDLPIQIGGFHQLGSNFIVMNKKLLKAVAKSGSKKLTNAYVFHILLHEYLHSLGYVNEQETQIISHTVSEEALGRGHLATQIARYGIGYIFQHMKDMEESQEMGEIETIDIDRGNLNYFG